jgi:hypothetical protein
MLRERWIRKQLLLLLLLLLGQLVLLLLRWGQHCRPRAARPLSRPRSKCMGYIKPCMHLVVVATAAVAAAKVGGVF